MMLYCRFPHHSRAFLSITAFSILSILTCAVSEGGEIRFIHQRFRDFLVGEYLAQGLHVPQEVEDDEPLTSPVFIIEKKLWDAVIRLCAQGPSPSSQTRTDLEGGATSEETSEADWSIEMLRNGGKILQYVLEFAPAAARTLYARDLVSRELTFPVDHFYGGIYYSTLEAVCLVHKGFPSENILRSNDLMAVFDRSWRLGQEFADFALYAIAACGIKGLAERLANEIEVAPGITLAEFPGDLKDRAHVRNLAHAVNFPSYWFFSLWRLEREWALAKLPSILRFMTLSTDHSDSNQIIMFMARRPTSEVLERPTKTAIKSYIKHWRYRDSDGDQMVAPLAFLLQNDPSYWGLLYELAAREILRSRQLYSIFELLGQQFHEEFDEWDPLLRSYSGNHKFMPPVGTFPQLPAQHRDELQQRIWAYMDQLASKRGFANWTDFD
jgi:hypothetical protein